MVERRLDGCDSSRPVKCPFQVKDLSYLYCWVCSEEEFRSPDALSEADKSVSDEKTRSRFVHACKCSLVAHEKCLLSWIRQCRRDKPDTVVACPQCKTPYELEYPKPLILTILERCHKAVRTLVPVGATIAAGGAIWTAATAYGCLAIRLFLGRNAARRTLSGRWPWHFWVDIPLIPIMLVASSLPILANFSTWLPTLIALPISSAPMPTRRAIMMYRYSTEALLPRSYPPSPVLTTLMLPWLRVIYLTLKRQIYRSVLSSPAPRQPRATNDDSRRRMRGRVPPPRMVIVGDGTEGAQLVDGINTIEDGDTYETLEDGSIVPRGNWVNEQGMPLDELEYRVFDEAELPETIYVSCYSLSKLLVQSLAFPFITSFMGGILGATSKYSPTLRKILGIAPGIEPQPGCESWTNLPWMQQQERSTNVPFVARGAEPLWVDDLSAVYDDLDPVWYRNALGGMLYLLIKDSLVLLYCFLRKKQHRQQRIKDLPFSEGVARELLASRP